jgi:hypothetical protein
LLAVCKERHEVFDVPLQLTQDSWQVIVSQPPDEFLVLLAPQTHDPLPLRTAKVLHERHSVGPGPVQVRQLMWQGSQLPVIVLYFPGVQAQVLVELL